MIPPEGGKPSVPGAEKLEAALYISWTVWRRKRCIENGGESKRFEQLCKGRVNRVTGVTVSPDLR